MEAMMMAREIWTDERLDDLSGRVERGFESIQQGPAAIRSEMGVEFQAVRSEMRDEAAAIRTALFETRQLMIRLSVCLAIVVLGLVFALVIGLLAARV